MHTNSFKRNGRLCRSSGLFNRLFALTFLALLLATVAHADPTLEHVDGLPSWADNDVALSGNGQWFAWTYEDNSIPWLTILNLETGMQTTVDLEVTTGFVGWDFPNVVLPDISHDGSLIAVIADHSPTSTGPDDLLLVIDSAGAEIARLTGNDEVGDNAWFAKEIFIDASGRYVSFTSNATRLEAVIGGVTKPLSDFVEGWESAFRLDVLTGEIKLVGIKAGGSELKDYSYALGISDSGRYVLFQSEATSLPGANGDMRLYLRDMSTTAASGTILVSVDESGTPISGLACCSTEPDISDDGSRVVYTENSRSSSDGQNHTFIWTSDTGSSSLAGSAIELTSVTDDSDINISGDGRWLTADYEVFSRLDIDSGSTDPRPDDDGSPARLDDPRISANGEIILFWNNDLTKPVGEDGRWWALRYPAGAPPDTTAPQWPGGASLSLLQGPNNVQISWPQASDDTAVTSYIVYRDGLEIAQVSAPALSYTDSYDTSGTYTYTVEATDAAGNESIDGPSAEITVEYLSAIVIEVSETILVNDDASTIFGVNIVINETITVSDESLALPSIDIAITEVFTVSDDVAVNVGPTLADTIILTLPDGPLVPGSVITADAGGFKPFTPVQAFLQSEPVLVGEEQADADGNVSFVITIPANFPPGEHTLILLGQSPDGSERRLTAALKVELPDTILQNGFE